MTIFHQSGIFGLLVRWLLWPSALWFGGATNKKGAQQSTAAIDKANKLSDIYGGNAAGLRSTLEPQLQREANTGFGPEGLAAMNTASQQSAGGATAGAVGAMGRAAARTRNAGGYAAAQDEAVREGGRAAGQRAVEIQGANEKQKEAGRRALQGLYGTEVGSSLESLGMVPGLINAGTNANKYQASPLMSGLKDLEGMALAPAAMV